ncbi:MAG: hypothetical protein JWQ09_2769, partial [Segetibacter sp.]|nr:hypothetical protein [Segetibacter sp.]
QTYTTGDLAAASNPEWKQYGFFFNTPATASSVVLRLINNSTGGCGNDLAIDDITFRPCGPQLTPSIKGVTGRVKELCVGDNADVTLQCNVSAGYNNPSYLWQQSKDAGNTWTDIPGEITTTLVRSFTSTIPVGQYLYRLSVGEATNIGLTSCRVASAALTVRVNTNPVTSTTSNSPACEGNSLVLSATGGSAEANYVWSGINSFSGTGSSIVIKNVQFSNAGKYYVQVTNSAGCKNTDSTTVVVIPAPVITTAFANRNICKGDSVLLGSSGGTSYLWSPSAGLSSAVIADPVAKPSDSTVYKVVVANASSCTASATVTINVISKPIANAGPDKVIVEGQSVQLDGSVTSSNTSISWFPGLYIDNIHSLQPSVSPVTNTSYILTATSNDGCGTSSDTTSIHVYKKVIIPNAFSPNADGLNDTWNIIALAAYDNYELSVFNRYGQIVFNTKNYSQPWNGTFNGKPLPVGTYYYLLDLKLGLPKLTGFVVILK